VQSGERSRKLSVVVVRSRSRFLRVIAQSASGAAALVAVASCGSRTGLFGSDEALQAAADPDAGIDAPAGGDSARPDAPDDARRDGRIDATLIDAPPDAPVACVPGTFTFGLATSQLLFVLDRSGSMDYRLDDDLPADNGEPSRWTVLHDALEETILPFSDEIAMGARFFPAETASGTNLTRACIQDPTSLAIPPALSNAQTILSVFSRTAPIGGTPTADALLLSATQLSESRAVARAMVIATDGAPNCNLGLDPDTCVCSTANCSSPTNCLDDVRTINAVRDIFEVRKIPVYVIGIGVVSGVGPTLDSMAIAGGRPRAGAPRYFPAETPGELRDAFTVVRESVARCSYITPSAPEDPDAIAVVVSGASVTRDPTHTNGWDWIDQAYGHLQLFGPACSLATRENVAGTVACPDPDR
jgi:hypothetical protein